MTDQINHNEQRIMLAILRLRPNAYGVSIKDELAERTGADMSIATIYVALDRLEQKGFVNSRQGPVTSERGGRRKMFFELTAPGQVALQQSLRALDALRSGVKIAGAMA